MRGNRIIEPGTGLPHGSIPARAGEPIADIALIGEKRVYPRACGGTKARRGYRALCRGLSPRVRGNPVCRTRRRKDRGSIPARAGEPPLKQTSLHLTRVYPRACGGTPAAGRERASSGGLSPRVRGNPKVVPAAVMAKGSIPARAGEPMARNTRGWVSRVYPRACGGTPSADEVPALPPGLSPRVRGNRNHDRGFAVAFGSIPARAGEPETKISRLPMRRVYPRACGGTLPSRDLLGCV